MSETSPILSLPYIQPSQAQKHVTHNEALRVLDAVVQLAVEDRDRADPPGSPQVGQRHIVAPGAIGAWAGHDHDVAVFEETGWSFAQPRAGWRAEVLAEGQGVIFDGSHWGVPTARLDNLPGVGVNVGSDDINRLSVSAPATLLSHDGAGHRVKINKAGPGDTASLLFQTGFSGRAEMGPTGTDAWCLKVSADGTAWTEALTVNGTDGRVTGAAVQASASDVTAGRLMRTDYGYSWDNAVGTVGQAAGVPTGAILQRGSNANGSFVRFADGTQMCWARVTLLYDDFYVLRATWAYPAVFASMPVVSHMPDLSTATGYATSRPQRTYWGEATAVAPTPTMTFLDLYRITEAANIPNGSTIVIAVTAVGRWF